MEEGVKRNLLNCVIIPVCQLCGHVDVVLRTVSLTSEIRVEVDFKPEQDAAIHTKVTYYYTRFMVWDEL